MRPANLSLRCALQGARRGKSWELRDRGDPVLRLGDELLDPGADRAGLLLEVLAHRPDLTLDAAAVLLHRALDDRAALTQLTLELGPRAPHLTLEPVARAGAAALVALELTLDGGPGAVLGGQDLHGRDQVLPRQQAGADRHEHGALGQDLRL